MVQNLIVSGKEYLPSAELARHFGYTPDYVSRLAREGKVAASNVNRKWFVDEESLKEFVILASVDKKVRSTELKKQRKVEQLLRAQALKEEKKKPELLHTQVALAQALVILMCGAFVSLLGWTVADNNIAITDLTSGLEDSYTQIAGAIIPEIDLVGMFSDGSVSTATVPLIDGAEEVKGEYIGSDQYLKFSDEVEITFEEDEMGIVRPVFKDGEDGQEYRMLVAPINEGG